MQTRSFLFSINIITDMLGANGHGLCAKTKEEFNTTI